MPSRIDLGVEFGPNSLSDSHSAFYLGGTEYAGVRSTHDDPLGKWERTGSGSLVTLWLAGLWSGRRCMERVALTTRVGKDAGAAPPGHRHAACGALGVLVESPFGAILYFVALGLLASRRDHDTGTRRLAIV